ncbi:Bug family tripartite tricarboxylate transporter substrate binding protein [Variovorax sp. RCC_210]|uniref:Bug family tripartite tricarboxylate transporter substrate binding protein n=1 Tax=Variovorax sp. RCC_210 TaxID=3239217 RepID=UPI003526097D
MQRRFHLSVLFAALTAFTAAAPAHAQQKTDAQKQLASERFTLISPFPPGGPVDTLARVLSDGLAKRYGQAAVVDNQVGAAGNIGMEKVKRAKGDGHTLLVIPAGNVTINPTLMPAFPFDMAKDFVPITMLAKAPNVLVASPSSGIRNAKELVAQAKARPNTLSYASPGVGSGLHLAGELFKQQAGIDMLHVPYKGTAPALNDVLGGSVPLMFSNLPATLPFLKQGKLVAIGITEAHRSAAAPDIPTLAEQGIQGVSVTSWYGLMAPRGTPPAVVEQLAKDAAEMLAQPEVRERLKLQGMTDAAMKPAEFASYIRDETAVWARIIKARNIVAE